MVMKQQSKLADSMVTAGSIPALSTWRRTRPHKTSLCEFTLRLRHNIGQINCFIRNYVGVLSDIELDVQYDSRFDSYSDH